MVNDVRTQERERRVGASGGGINKDTLQQNRGIYCLTVLEARGQDQGRSASSVSSAESCGEEHVPCLSPLLVVC